MADGGHISSEVRVRVGTLDDLDQMMVMARMACDENAFAPYDDYLLLSEIYPALALDHGVCGLIGEPGGVIEGGVLLRVGRVWYSQMPMLEERAIFIHPAYRTAPGGRAARLCEFSKAVADELDMPLTIGVLSSQRTEAKVRMYRRIMGEPSGAYWIYGVRTGQFAHEHGD